MPTADDDCSDCQCERRFSKPHVRFSFERRAIRIDRSHLRLSAVTIGVGRGFAFLALYRAYNAGFPIFDTASAMIFLRQASRASGSALSFPSRPEDWHTA